MDWLALFTAFGFGSIVSAAVQWWLDGRRQSKSHSFQERKEAYLGLLESWVRQEDDGFTESSLRDVGHWHLRSQLVASSETYALLCEWQVAEPGTEERKTITDKLKLSMRNDLRL